MKILLLFLFIISSLLCNAQRQSSNPCIIELSEFPTSVEDLFTASSWLNQTVQTFNIPDNDSVIFNKPIPFASFRDNVFAVSDSEYGWTISLLDIEMNTSPIILYKQPKKNHSVDSATFKSSKGVLQVMTCCQQRSIKTDYYILNPSILPYTSNDTISCDSVPFSIIELRTLIQSEQNVLPTDFVYDSLFQLQNDGIINNWGVDFTWRELKRFNYNDQAFAIISRSNMYGDTVYLTTSNNNGNFGKLLMIYSGQLPSESDDAESIDDVNFTISDGVISVFILAMEPAFILEHKYFLDGNFTAQ